MLEQREQRFSYPTKKLYQKMTWVGRGLVYRYTASGGRPYPLPTAVLTYHKQTFAPQRPITYHLSTRGNRRRGALRLSLGWFRALVAWRNRCLC